MLTAILDVMNPFAVGSSVGARIPGPRLSSYSINSLKGRTQLKFNWISLSLRVQYESSVRFWMVIGSGEVASNR